LPVRYNYFYHSNPPAQVTLDPNGLLVFGALLPVEIHVPPQLAQSLGQANQPIPQPQSGLSLIDTGCTFTSVHEPLLIALGLHPINVVQSGTANGPVDQNVYAVRLNFPTLGWDVGLLEVTGSNLAGQTTPASHGQAPQLLVALIGRNLLAACSFHWDGSAGFWSISW